MPWCLRANFLLLLGPPFLQILQFSPDQIPQEVVTPLAIFYEKNFCFKSGQGKKASEQESSHFGKQFQYPSGYLMVPVSVRRLHRYTIQLKKKTQGTQAIILHFLVTSIDVLSLHLLFSHYRPRDGTPENWFFFEFRLMNVHPRAYICIINEKTKGNPGKHHVVWIEKTKQTRWKGVSELTALKLGLIYLCDLICR